MPKETERKFRIRKQTEAITDILTRPRIKLNQTWMEQAYIRNDPDGEIRIRRSKSALEGERIVITGKSAGGISRDEEQGIIKGITSGFLEMMFVDKAIGKKIVKIRYKVPHTFDFGGKECSCLIEIDEYTGHLAGLWIVEVEFDSEEAAAAFTFPDWFPKDYLEVTSDPRYKNAALADAEGPPPFPTPSPVV